MMTYKIFIFLTLSFFSTLCLACKGPINENYSYSDEKFPTIFIGKITERKLFKDALDGFTKIELKFTPLKIIKGEVSLSEYFSFTTTKETLTFIVGYSALIFANENNEIEFGHECHRLSRSLGHISLTEIDELIKN